jgi:hypothetical protein
MLVATLLQFAFHEVKQHFCYFHLKHIELIQLPNQCMTPFLQINHYAFHFSSAQLYYLNQPALTGPAVKQQQNKLGIRNRNEHGPLDRCSDVLGAGRTRGVQQHLNCEQRRRKLTPAKPNRRTV